MPWQQRPRKAIAFVLLGAVVAIAAAGAFCRPGEPSASRLASTGARHDTANCARIRGDRWNPLSGVEYTGRLTIETPAADRGAVVMIIGDTLPLDIEAQSVDGRPVPIRRERLRGGPGVEVPSDFWIEGEGPWSMPQVLMRVTLAASPSRAQAVELALGRRAPRVLARLTGYPNDVTAAICAARLAVPPAFANRGNLSISPAMSEYFATGWYAEETMRGGQGLVRWMSEHGALLVPSARDGSVLVRLHAVPPLTANGDNNAPLLSLRVNDVFDAITVPMTPAAGHYEWSIPDTAWVAGTNELLFSVSRTLRVSNRDGRTSRVVGLGLQRLDVQIR